jgi:hypothetical protein
VIAVILGSKDPKVRDAKAAEWIETGFARLPPLPPPAPVIVPEAVPEPVPVEPEKKHPLLMTGLILLFVAVVAGAVMRLRRKKR